jgi:cytidylate kinase
VSGGRVRVIAIDGPGGSGKSTVARAVARRLGMPHLDTGAMYRSVALVALRRGVDPDDADTLARLARSIEIELTDDTVTVDGLDATQEIRGAEVTATVSAVSAHGEVREEMVRRQREWATSRGGGVVEGRDIGTTVFPDAELKIYLTASDEERARRRSEEAGTDQDSVVADLARRDQADATRSASPMSAADDAVVIDTTGRSVDEVVAEVLERL